MLIYNYINTKEENVFLIMIKVHETEIIRKKSQFNDQLHNDS